LPDVDGLVAGVLAGDRRSLARAITLVESTRDDHRAAADEVVARVLDRTGRSVRIGVSGAPGAGKSTFVEAFGLHLVAAGHRVAVLAVDPSSTRSGGSILGDKTRMADLARHPAAFVRPSPSGGSTGGVARRTREALLLCEAAGFDRVLVETVGVGQAEVAVSELVDLFLLLAAPGGGDELQAIKRGIAELADVVVVTKADGELAGPARHAAADWKAALQLVRPSHPEWQPRVVLVSSVTGDGIADVDAAVAEFGAALGEAGIARLRADQARSWMWREVTDSVLDRLRRDPEVRRLLHRLEAEVAAGAIAPGAAARRLLDAFLASGR
jgi:LAO/AO transport system kinase